jgi:Ion channel
MLFIFLAAFLLAVITICMHAVGISLLLRYSTRKNFQALTTSFAIMRTLLRVVAWLFLLHLAEIALWALFYLWRAHLSDAEAAFYFSGVTYTTAGYGDIVLAKPWPTPRAGRRPRRLPHVQLVHALFLCRRQPHPSEATAGIPTPLGESRD